MESLDQGSWSPGRGLKGSSSGKLPPSSEVEASLHPALSANLLFSWSFLSPSSLLHFLVSQPMQGEMGAARHSPLSQEQVNFIMKLPEAEMLPDVKE